MLYICLFSIVFEICCVVLQYISIHSSHISSVQQPHVVPGYSTGRQGARTFCMNDLVEKGTWDKEQFPL